MKKSELREIIREEIKTLKEGYTGTISFKKENDYDDCLYELENEAPKAIVKDLGYDKRAGMYYINVDYGELSKAYGRNWDRSLEHDFNAIIA